MSSSCSPSLQRVGGPVVLAAAEERGAEVEEELRPLGLDVDGLAQHGHRLLVALGPAEEEAELHAGVHRPRIGGEDALELDLGLVVLARFHQGGGEEVARAQVARLEEQRAAERRRRRVPALLLVLDGAQLEPDARVARGRLRELLDLGLRFLEAAQPHEEIAETLDEGGVVGVGPDGGLVRLDRLVRLLLALVDVAEGLPGAVLVGIELDGSLQSRERLVPALGLDGDAAEQIVPLGEPRALGDEAEQHGAGLFVRLLLEVLLREGEVGVGRLRRDARSPSRARLPPRAAGALGDRARPASGTRRCSRARARPPSARRRRPRWADWRARATGRAGSRAPPSWDRAGWPGAARAMASGMRPARACICATEKW